ncbi:hypothetical protein BMS3Abin01_00291 [bacterium BMS3Abin01]|nr:hypothetical protein BMS3Abin01_00291 [bacterium BMS3Abin01]
MALVCIVFFFLFRVIIRDWSSIRNYDWSFDLPWLLASLVMFAVIYCGHATGWLLILWRFRFPVPFLPGFYVWSKSLLARYVPGNVLMVVGRVMMIERYNVPKRVSFTSVIYEQIMLVASATTVLSVALPLWPLIRDKTDLVWLILIVPFLAIISLHPAVIGSIGNFVFKKIGREPLEEFLPFSTVILMVLYYCIFWIVGGMALFAMARAVTTEITMGDLPITIASFPLAWLMSVLFFISPSGLGVREGVYAYTLGFAFDNTGVASAFAIMARLWWTMLEISFVLIIMGLVKLFHQKPEP